MGEIAAEDPKLLQIKKMINGLKGDVSEYEGLEFPPEDRDDRTDSDKDKVKDLMNAMYRGMYNIGDVAMPEANSAVLTQVVNGEQLKAMAEEEVLTLIQAQVFGGGTAYTVTRLIDDLFEPNRVRYSSPRLERGEDAKRRVFLDIGLMDPKMAQTFETQGFVIKSNNGTMVVELEVSRLFEFKRLLEELSQEKSAAQEILPAEEIGKKVAIAARARLEGLNPYGDGTTGPDEGIVDLEDKSIE